MQYFMDDGRIAGCGEYPVVYRTCINTYTPYLPYELMKRISVHTCIQPINTPWFSRSGGTSTHATALQAHTDRLHCAVDAQCVHTKQNNPPPPAGNCAKNQFSAVVWDMVISSLPHRFTPASQSFTVS